MLSLSARPLIEATVPVLLANGEAITRHFYQRMFSHHPDLKNLFNLGNQSSGDQAQALAGAVYAFAVHMDKPEKIGPVLDRIAHKHVSLGITPAQYAIVGRHLLASLGEVLGAAITPDIAAAWDEVYWLMATELVAREARLYQLHGWQVGGEWPALVVSAKEIISDDTVALTLRAADGAPLGSFLPGQYLSVALHLPDLDLTQVRQYSLSNAPGEPVWRITVKRVVGTPVSPEGAVSNRIHAAVRVGDQLRVGPPSGDFHLRPDDGGVVLISAGVGVTPMVSMLRHIERVQPQRPVVFAYATTDADHYPHRKEVEDCLQGLPRAQYHLWLETVNGSVPSARQGRMDMSVVESLPSNADYYLCGPVPFMQQQRRWLMGRAVDPSRIHYEVFGPDLFGEQS